MTDFIVHLSLTLTGIGGGNWANGLKSSRDSVKFNRRSPGLWIIQSILINHHSWHKHGMTDATHIQGIRAHLNRPVVLVGMPASGKTSLGRGLSHILDIPFIDIDHAIEQTIGQKIVHFFEEHGEPAFRDLETQTIRAVFADNPGACVISTGGGAVLRPDNRPVLFNNTYSLWVRANIASLLERTAMDTQRPLLKNADPEKVLLNLQTIRYPLYQQASMIVDTDGRLPEQILPEIVEKINERLSTS